MAKYLARCTDSEGAQRVVALDADERTLALPVDTVAELLAKPRADILKIFADATTPVTIVKWLPPVDGQTEVWAAGVTYLRSRDARTEESDVPDVYTKVYNSPRPELFFKSVPWKVVTTGDPIGVRADSTLDVPEPEVAVLVNAHAEIIAYTICNDVSSRSIEGENPLYLPQAKVYSGACAVLHKLRIYDNDFNPNTLEITGEIIRNNESIWQAEASTSQLNRTFTELVEWLYRGDQFPASALLSTGTCIVPGINTTLKPGDVVKIKISELGELVNQVERGKLA